MRMGCNTNDLKPWLQGIKIFVIVLSVDSIVNYLLSVYFRNLLQFLLRLICEFVGNQMLKIMQIYQFVRKEIDRFLVESDSLQSEHEVPV